MEWKPSAPQAIFLSLPYTIKEALYGGGAGSAKTETLLMYPIVHKFHENPRFKQVFMRRTYPELRNEVIPRSKQIYRHFGAKFNAGEMKWEFESGASIFMAHCETEDDVHKYDSMEINLYTPDELTSFTEWIYLYIAFQRVRTSIGTGLPAIIRAGGMPGGIGHTFVKKRFIDPLIKLGITDLKDARKQPIIGKGGIKRIYIHATLADNPHIDPDYKNSLEALPEAEKRAKKYGDWNAYLGQVFDEFREKLYPDEPDYAIHVIDSFAIPDYWPKIVIGDWGFRANTWIGFGAISPTGRLYVYRELHWKNTLIADWAPVVKKFIESENPKVIKFCQSVNQDKGQEHSIREQIEMLIGRPIELTGNVHWSRISGKALLHEYLRWKQAPKSIIEIKPYDDEHAMWLMRNKGPEEYKNYLDKYNKFDEVEQLPKLQIFKDCQMLINAIKACIYAKPKDGIPAEDVAEFDGDDAYDGIRYMVDAASQYVTQAKEEFRKIQETSKLENEFKQTLDYNILFNRARALERQQKQSVAPIRIFHHR
jgi:hypothetical protein